MYDIIYELQVDGIYCANTSMIVISKKSIDMIQKEDHFKEIKDIQRRENYTKESRKLSKNNQH